MKQYLTIEELSSMIHLEVSTIYKYTCARKIPFIKVSGKRIIFSEDDINTWLSAKSVFPV